VNKHLISSIALTSVLFAGGCATKKYVAKTTAPIQEKLDTVATKTDQQGQTINQQGQDLKKQGSDIDATKSTLSQAQTDIAANRERATAADARAGDALQKTDANTKDLGALRGELRSVVANLDDYKPAGTATVSFGFNKDTLTPDAKAELDKLVSDKSTTTKRYFVAIEGFTDQIGTVAYNNQLSKRRADAVMQYLVAKHDIPVYRIHVVGLGEEKPADPGKDRAARAKNRRVEVTFFSADISLPNSANSGNGNANQ
jgi:outer membrane protein OmpA-like peptidoglycan-associated protein